MKFIKWLFGDALNPGVTTRLWRVDCDDWGGGTFKGFWFKSNAMKYAKEQEDLFVDVINEITKKRIRVSDNPDYISPPVRYI